MALIKCIECSKEISDTANSCPHCGKKLKKSPIVKVIGIITALIVLILFINSLISARNLAQSIIAAHKQLESALGYSPADLYDQAKELIDKFIISETEIIQEQAVLACYIKDEGQIKKLMPSVLDMAAGRHISLTRSADEIGQLLKNNKVGYPFKITV